MNHARSFILKPSGTAIIAPPRTSRSTPHYLHIGEVERGAWLQKKTTPLLLDEDVRARHVYIAGQTGTGKSVLLANMMAQDLVAGHGVGLLDPHGTLATEILGYVPTSRFSEVVYFNPADADRPIGFNILAGATAQTAPRITEMVLSAFLYFFGGDAIMASSQDLLRNALRALLDTASPTLLDVLRLIEDEVFRRRVTPHITDPLIAYYWRETVPAYSERAFEEITRPILNKLRRVLTNPICRNVLAQTQSTFSLARVMDASQIFIANLDIGLLGEGVSSLLGALLSAQFADAAFSRRVAGDNQLPPFYLYQDEFQVFSSDAFSTILSQLRKYRLALTIGHQYREQLSDQIESAVFGNAATTIAFRLGAEDARKFSQHLMLDEMFREADLKGHQQLAALANYQAFVKTLADGAPETHRLACHPPLPRLHDRAHRIIARSRDHFGRDRALIEASVDRLYQRRAV